MTLDLPDPLAPIRTATGGRSFNVTSASDRNPRTRMLSIFACSLSSIAESPPPDPSTRRHGFRPPHRRHENWTCRTSRGDSHVQQPGPEDRRPSTAGGARRAGSPPPRHPVRLTLSGENLWYGAEIAVRNRITASATLSGFGIRKAAPECARSRSASAGRTPSRGGYCPRATSRPPRCACGSRRATRRARPRPRPAAPSTFRRPDHRESR